MVTLIGNKEETVILGNGRREAATTEGKDSCAEQNGEGQVGGVHQFLERIQGLRAAKYSTGKIWNSCGNKNAREMGESQKARGWDGKR